MDHTLALRGRKKQWNFSAHLLCFSKPLGGLRAGAPCVPCKACFSHTKRCGRQKCCILIEGFLEQMAKLAGFCFIRLAGLGQVIKQPAIRMYLLIGQTLFRITIAVFESVQLVPPWLMNKIIAHKCCISSVACGLSGLFVFSSTNLLFYLGLACSSLLLSKLCSSCLFYACFFNS